MTLSSFKSRLGDLNEPPVFSEKVLRRLWMGLPIAACGLVATVLAAAVLVPLLVNMRSEMLRAERAFEDLAIREELDAYNPLIPDGSNFKATMMIEYPDPLERARELARLIGVEDRVSLSVGSEVICAMADEDLDRENDVKTSAVHFLRFELSVSAVNAVKSGAAMRLAIDHPNYSFEALLPDHVRASLCMDLV